MTNAVDPQRTRLLLTAVMAGLGAYLLLLSLNSQLPFILSGLSPIPFEAALLLVLQLLIALAVFTVGWLVAPATVGRRIGAAAIGLGFAIVFLLVATMRVTPVFSRVFGAEGIWIGQTFGNPHVMTALALGLGWLVVTASRGVSYLLLLLAFILAPVQYLLVVGGLPAAAQVVMLALWILVVGAILGLSRLAAPRTAPVSPWPASEAGAPQA